MRKRILRSPILIMLCIFLHHNSFSYSIINKAAVGNNIAPANKDYLRASVFIKLSAKQFETITGKKLNFTQRIYFRIVQRRLKHELKKDPALLITNYYDTQKEKFKFDALWFVIASFIGPLGILAAYTSKQRKGGPTKKNKITSAWLGFALWVLWFGFAFIF